MKRKGTVKWFNPYKGYGFIQEENKPALEDNVYVHFSAIDGEGFKELTENEEVEFEALDTPKGPNATKVWRKK